MKYFGLNAEGKGGAITSDTTSRFHNPLLSNLVSCMILIIMSVVHLSSTSMGCGFGIGTLVVLIYTVILGVVCTIIHLYPKILTPFSNTFGYLFILMFGIHNVFNEALNGGDKGPLEELGRIISDKPNLVINTLVPESLNKLWEVDRARPPIDNVDGNAYIFSGNPTKLFKLIVLKNIVSSVIWYFLAGCLAISASATLMSSNCVARNTADS